MEGTNVPNSYVCIYVHIVWATWDRLPLLTPEIESQIHAAIVAKCKDLHGIPLEIGGTANHVHLLIRMSAIVSIAQLVKEMKGVASHLVNHNIAPGSDFRWQGAYAAFSVEADRVGSLRAYIRNQKCHHNEDTLILEWERCEE